MASNGRWGGHRAAAQPVEPADFSAAAAHRACFGAGGREACRHARGVNRFRPHD